MTLKVCSLASGSSGNATYVSTGATSVLVDCGASAREVVVRLAHIGIHPNRLKGILVTHAHSDHYRSAGTLHARYGIPIYVDPSTSRALARRGRNTSWRRIAETHPIPDRIGDLEVMALDTIHGYPPDEGRTVAYHLSHGGVRAGIVTDLGSVPEGLCRVLRGVDLLVIEANHDEITIRRKLSDPRHAVDWHYLTWVLGAYGHLSNRQCAEALAAILTGKETHIFLGHLSVNHPDPRRDNNDPETALSEVRGILERERVPLPHFHKTHRIGLVPCGPSAVVEVG